MGRVEGGAAADRKLHAMAAITKCEISPQRWARRCGDRDAGAGVGGTGGGPKAGAHLGATIDGLM